MTVLQFFFLILGAGIFAWAHPDLATVLVLVGLSNLTIARIRGQNAA